MKKVFENFILNIDPDTDPIFKGGNAVALRGILTLFTENTPDIMSELAKYEMSDLWNFSSLFGQLIYPESPGIVDILQAFDDEISSYFVLRDTFSTVSPNKAEVQLI